MNETAVAELFDNYRNSYGTVVQSSIDFSGLPHSFFMRAKADLLRNLIERHFGGNKPAMLDVGCGVGSFHPFLRGLVDCLCGIDVSSASVAQARSNHPDAEYRAFDGKHFPYESGTFGLVTAICVLHHVPPTQWRSFTQEMRRIVKPGGLVCIIEHNPLNPLTRLAVGRCEFDDDAVLLRAGQTRRLMADAGLRQLDSRYFLLFPSAAKLARRAEFALGRVPLGAQYAAWGVA
ncbi:MAG TPA: methyltransferase domain-containing protein [Pseudolabrys sp.]|nr:methyltransferase domain-containing protein [Pseudolabrys sp.]